MRLTVDVLQRAEQYLNPCKERELHLRGLKIPAIENLAVMQDQFDVIDLTDNEIRKLDNFPKMKRLTTLLLHNNAIVRIGKMVAENVPGLLNLILTNNRLANLGELEHLVGLTKLIHLSLLDNPLALRPHYRAYVIHKIPSLKTLDYAKITKTEREESAKFFKTQAGQVFLTGVLEDKHTPPATTSSSSSKPPLTLPDRPHTAPVLVLTDAQKVQVRAAIEAATTREEIEVIEKHLKAGSLAFLTAASAVKVGVHVLEVTTGVATTNSSQEMTVEGVEKGDAVGDSGQGVAVSGSGEDESKGVSSHSNPFNTLLPCCTTTTQSSQFPALIY